MLPGATTPDLAFTPTDREPTFFMRTGIEPVLPGPPAKAGAETRASNVAATTVRIERHIMGNLSF
jgi:hypothetical protein